MRNVAAEERYFETPSFARTPLPPEQKRRVLAFMRESGELFCATAGHFDDAATGDPVESCSWGWFRKGGWQWSERELYHLDRYDLAPNPGFVSYALLAR